MALTALAKVSGRFSAQPSALSSIKDALAAHRRSMDAETQTRAAEFEKLLGHDLDSVRAGVVERMPPPEYVDVPYEEYVLNPTAMRMKALTIIKRPALQPEDLISAGVGADAKAAAAAAAAVEATKQSVVSDLLNLMDDAPASQSPAAATSPAASAASPAAAAPDALADLLSASTLSPTVSSETGFNQEYEVYNSNGMRITLNPSKRPKLPNVVEILATFYNEGDAAISDLNFLVAVPKSQKLQISPPSGQTIPCGMSATQLVRVANPSKTPIRLRMKLSCVCDSQSVDNMFDFGGFPENIV
ncbi:clathrin associated protein complex large subunit [Coemansia sp. RSA 2598]|nr:clathrin associated protein complex large subunit [Coemansia sp. RSA 2598]